MAVAVAVNWSEYFYSIKQQCPWSYSAWQQGRILVRAWGRPEPLGDYSAIVYICKLNRRRLKKLCNKLNADPDYEWLWSHPNYGPYATPIPVLIQQSRQELARIRASLAKDNK